MSTFGDWIREQGIKDRYGWGEDPPLNEDERTLLVREYTRLRDERTHHENALLHIDDQLAELLGTQ